MYTGAEVSEARLKQLSAPSNPPSRNPRILPEAVFAGQDGRIYAGIACLVLQNPGLYRENALVLSGVALAGANQRSSGNGEDGILTALEVASLDFWGTRMVSVIRCETGLGDARHGEGVYGLR